MRLFTAIDLSNDVILRLERVMSFLRPEALIKWSPVDNLHVTTKFIGEWSQTRLSDVHQALKKLAPRAPFEVEVKGFGWFPNRQSPRVLWSGVEGGAALGQLMGDIDDAMTPLGIARENRPHLPHLTLARINDLVPLDPLREKLDALEPAVFGSFLVSQFYLYESQRGSNASRYRKLHEYSFEATAAGRLSS
jgi:2'-5' RNA ligase